VKYRPSGNHIWLPWPKFPPGYAHGGGKTTGPVHDAISSTAFNMKTH